MKIAIDGPGGAGKSSVAKALAADLGLVYVDTGALYRSVGLFMRRAGVNTASADEVAPLLKDVKLELRWTEAGQRVFLGDEDVSEAIRTPEASMDASAVSAIPAVREFLLGLQRDMANAGNVIMDGRDIGTVIMPDADLKIFLTASPEARAKRRFAELRAKGQDCTFEEVLADIIQRDAQDTGRDIAPAVPADDATIFDNSDMGLSETVDRIAEMAREKA
ncbi:MAG: (d)CMP kinase [Clostridia bacterium]|nr:(d)CMP kinase [Clostridia bacterium]